MIIPPNVKSLIKLALEEDLGRGDLSACVTPNKKMRARIITREPTVLSCMWLPEVIIRESSADLRVEQMAKCSEHTIKDQEIFHIEGDARDLLSIERTILNFLQRTCGVASLANSYRRALGDFANVVRITDTRKTIPGWRYLDKQAVRDGGLHNHRFGLDSGVLIKENHIRAAGGIKNAVEIVRANVPHVLKIEVEVTNIGEAREAIESGADALLLDNFSVNALQNIVPELKRRNVFLEASGGIHLKNIFDYAATGVDCISVGALTHSAPAANLSLLMM